MKYILSFLISFFLIGCSIGVNKSNLQVDNISEESRYQDLLVLEEFLIEPNLSLNFSIADSLYRKSLTFINHFPNSKNKESVLVLAAKCSDGLNLNEENIQLIDQLLSSFPESIDAPNYLYNKGKIYEEKLKDIAQAKIIYKELIKKYPKTELGLSMKLYLEFLDKSEAEQFKFLKD